MKYIDLFEKSKQIARDNNLTQLEVYQRFMFERILERISVSGYRDNFILKGGLLLSAMLGIESRTTRDMDVTIKGIDVSKEKMVNVLNQILSIDLEDGVKFKIINITDIREDDEYGGNKYHIIGKFDNLKVELEIDISTGDEVTPRELKFEYISIFDNKKIIIDSYNIETILAEKIETILRRGKYNARMKDYYDVYFFLHNMKDEINNADFRSALNNTLIKRESLEYYKDYEIILKEISTYERINEKWNIYSKKNKYANGIEFKNIIELIIEFIARIEEKSIV